MVDTRDCSWAVQYRRYGGPEVLEVLRRRDPRPGPGQVRLAVRAASVNPFDGKLRDGLLASPDSPHAPAAPVIPGTDVAGVVEALGAGVTGVAVGDEVLGRATGGAYAEKALAAAGEILRKPPGMSWEVAGSLEVVVNTAHSVLEALALGPGAVLLVHGASGGVGTIAVQAAVARGLRVVGSAGPAGQEQVAALGATPVVHGGTLCEQVRAAVARFLPAVATPGAAVDAVFDAAGRGVLTDLIALAGGPDGVVTVAHPDAPAHGVRFVGRRWVPGALQDTVDRITDGRLRSSPITTYPLDRAAQAMADHHSGVVRGKLVLTVPPHPAAARQP